MRKVLMLGLVCAAIVLSVAGCDLLGPHQFSSDPIAGAGTALTQPWTFASGYAAADAFTAGSYSVELHGIAPATTNPWDSFAYASGDPVIMFSSAPTTEPKRLQLNLFGDTSANQTVTFYDGATNYIMFDGWMELTVDTTAMTATVKLDITGGDMSFAGTATVPLKP